jgi:hypothetical protein
MTRLTITVTRTGGIAGLRREWRVDGDTEQWGPLIDACPWRSVPRDDDSRDRFVYSISVRASRKRHSATLPEAALTGPWKELVDRVQAVPPAGDVHRA